MWLLQGSKIKFCMFGMSLGVGVRVLGWASNLLSKQGTSESDHIITSARDSR